MQGACEVRGLAGKGPPHVSTGLGTMLLGVSGSCEDREVTSLPEELPREPDSEKETSCWKAGWSRSLWRANSLSAFQGGWYVCTSTALPCTALS